MTIMREWWTGTLDERRGWLVFLICGFLLWLASVLVYALTGNIHQIPTITQLGSYLVPVTYVVWVHENGRGQEITPLLLFSGFITGGVLGTLAATLLETYLLETSFQPLYLGVGLIEEGVKVVALMIVARNLVRRAPRDGVILGSAVGFGFAGFESSGYALAALLSEDRLNLRAMIETEILRALLAPLGHGLWTGILGGLLFRASDRGRWRLRPSFWLAFVAVSVMHALWNAMPGIGNTLALLLTTGHGEPRLLHHHGRLNPTVNETALLATGIQWFGLLALALIGTEWIHRLLVRFSALEPPHPSPVRTGWHWTKNKNTSKNTSGRDL